MAFKPKKQILEEPEPEVEEEIEEEKPIKKSEPKKTWTIEDVPTETTAVIYNNKTGERLDILGALVRILNAIEEV